MAKVIKCRERTLGKRHNATAPSIHKWSLKRQLLLMSVSDRFLVCVFVILLQSPTITVLRLFFDGKLTLYTTFS